MSNTPAPSPENLELTPYQRQTPEQWEATIKSVEGPMGHAVSIAYRDEVPQDKVDASISALHELGKEPGVLAWMIAPSLDERKGRVVLELGVFTCGQAFLDWRKSDAHMTFAMATSEIADWTVVDFPAGADGSLQMTTPAPRLGDGSGENA